MTYRELFEWAACLTEEELSENVTFYNSDADEFHLVDALRFAPGKPDVIERGYTILIGAPKE